MNLLGVLLLCLFAVGCGHDPRHAHVVVKNDVDIDALDSALIALHESTRGDTDIVRMDCDDAHFCITIEAVNGIRSDGEKCGGYTYPIGMLDDHADIVVTRDTGMTPMTIAHELMHAIGIHRHTDVFDTDNEYELMNREEVPGQEREIGWRTRTLYFQEFGVLPDPYVIKPLPPAPSLVSSEGAGDGEGR